MPDLLDAAQAYARLGWRVHPTRVNKAPLTESWTRDATTDPATIERWWHRWPRANVAVACGSPGPDVLDVDTKQGRPGMELLERLREAGLLRGAAAIVRTPSGGLHLWFAGSDQPGGAVGPGKAIELKATGGYVLVPPSRTDLGEYEVIERRDTAGRLDWSAVRRLLDPPKTERGTRGFRSAAGVDRLADWLAGQGEGNRNSALFWASCKALQSGAEDLRDLVAIAVDIGLPEREAVRTVESARRRIRRPA